jgi:hypothetical protein
MATRLEQNSDPVRWVDAWPVRGVSANIRDKIKAQLLRAHAAFWRSSDPEDVFAHAQYMQLAFYAVAQILFQAKILTTETLGYSLPELIWDAAISGGWWNRAAETRTDEFTEQFGHYWVNSGHSENWGGLFVAEISEWQGWLLDVAGAAPLSDDEIARRWSDLERRNEQFLVSRRQAREQRHEEQLSRRRQNFAERMTQELYDGQVTHVSLREFPAQRKTSSGATDPSMSPPPGRETSPQVVPAEQKTQMALAAARQAVVMPILESKHWTTNKWGTSAGVGRSCPYDYLYGKRKLTDENRKALAEALELKPEDLPN